MAFLDDISAQTRANLEAAKQQAPLDILRESALTLACAQRDGAANDPCPARDESPRGTLFGFGAALVKPETAFICEVKSNDPFQGQIAESFNYEEIAQDFEAAQADAVSCWAEPAWYKGSDEIFAYCRLAQKSLPMLYRGAVIDEYQLYQAKLLGAQAVLLSAALLDQGTIARFIAVCDELGLDAPVKVTNEAEVVTADAADARIMVLSRRNLIDGKLNAPAALEVRSLVRPDVVLVIEGGITSPEDAAAMAHIGADAVILAEGIINEPNKKAALDAFRTACA